MSPRHSTALLSIALFAGAVHAADPEIRVTIHGEVKPGIYGRVDIGTAPPPVLYPEPMVIVREPKPAKVQPVYLHVPPGHAKNWSKHCHKYNACGTPVYFVKSSEYEPKNKGKGKGKEKD